MLLTDLDLSDLSLPFPARWPVLGPALSAGDPWSGRAPPSLHRGVLSSH